MLMISIDLADNTKHTFNQSLNTDKMKEAWKCFLLKTKRGKNVPLSALAEVKNIQGPEFTNRFNLYRSAEVGGSPAPGYSSAQALSALEEVAAEVLPAGMGYEWGNMSYQEKKSIRIR